MHYDLRKSTRARHLRITIKADERVIVTIPKQMSVETGEVFAQSKQEWIENALKRLRLKKKPGLSIPQASAAGYQEHKEDARRLALEKLDQFNRHYNLSWKNVSIKNMTSRWGSCSRQGNLTFNYRIAFLPKEFADYLIVHELCHLKQFNHSKAFWDLVGETIPDYQALRKHIRVL